jgi:hypothetical protein
MKTSISIPLKARPGPRRNPNARIRAHPKRAGVPACGNAPSALTCLPVFEGQRPGPSQPRPKRGTSVGLGLRTNAPSPNGAGQTPIFHSVSQSDTAGANNRE